ECSPGLFFPERIIGGSEANGKPATTTIAELSDVRVNGPLPDGIFQLLYPHNIYLTDSIRGVIYRVDPQGNQLSEARPLGGRVPPPPVGGVSDEPRTET